MGQFRIEVADKAKIDFEKIYKSGNKATIKKLEKIMLELSSNPHSGIGNPEPLKHDLTGFWSRRVNKRDRLIYKIIEEPNKMVVVISLLGHYI
jgi:toxin YoeB